MGHVVCRASSAGRVLAAVLPFEFVAFPNGVAVVHQYRPHSVPIGRELIMREHFWGNRESSKTPLFLTRPNMYKRTPLPNQWGPSLLQMLVLDSGALSICPA
jgi:hypothetical protein